MARLACSRRVRRGLIQPLNCAQQKLSSWNNSSCAPPAFIPLDSPFCIPKKHRNDKNLVTITDVPCGACRHTAASAQDVTSRLNFRHLFVAVHAHNPYRFCCPDAVPTARTNQLSCAGLLRLFAAVRPRAACSSFGPAGWRRCPSPPPVHGDLCPPLCDDVLQQLV